MLRLLSNLIYKALNFLNVVSTLHIVEDIKYSDGLFSTKHFELIREMMSPHALTIVPEDLVAYIEVTKGLLIPFLWRYNAELLIKGIKQANELE
jgi:hypothetical protein